MIVMKTKREVAVTNTKKRNKNHPWHCTLFQCNKSNHQITLIAYNPYNDDRHSQ